MSDSSFTFSKRHLGLMAIAASIAYTVGNKPYGYRGLGDLSVLMFFGWLGVAGTYYLQAGQIDSIIMLPATACGLLAVGVLNIYVAYNFSIEFWGTFKVFGLFGLSLLFIIGQSVWIVSKLGDDAIPDQEARQANDS